MSNPTWALSAIVLAATALAAACLAWPRAPRPRARRAPPLLLLPDDPEATWAVAPVHLSPLRVAYREADGSLTECIIHPKTIRGEQVGHGRVRPCVVNAFCEEEQAMRALRVERILSAADLRSSEFIDDLHTYFGSAQPGGAPAPIYQDAARQRVSS